jgi:predicted acetylornithine/succinylornithine family transaminase
MSLTEREHRHFLPTYKRLPIEVDHAEGMYIHAIDGTRYLDFLGGIAVNTLGHSHPDIKAAVERQLGRYTHLSNYFYQDAQIEFAEKLAAMSGFPWVFLGNSGAEAMEGAIKLARSWGAPQGRREIIGFTGGFHGRTYGSLSIMDKPLYKDGMGPFLPDMRVIPFNDPEALERETGESTCAIVVEFLQGEGGVRWADPAFAAKIAELQSRHGFLVIADEVQGGAGRTGRFFSFSHLDARPDIVTLAKGIGGGLPMGAILASDRMEGVWSPGQHGTTFGGNALSCAAGSVVLDALANGLIDHAATVGAAMIERLRALQAQYGDLILEVRGAGAMAGLELSCPAAPVVEKMLRRGVIVNATSDRVVRLLPPLIFQPEHIEQMATALDACLAEMRSEIDT